MNVADDAGTLGRSRRLYSDLYDLYFLLEPGRLLTGMERDLPEWIRQILGRFTSDHPQPVDTSLPKPILERLAALEEAERRRSGEGAGERRQPREPAWR